jgi:hypothetical protein
MEAARTLFGLDRDEAPETEIEDALTSENGES